MAERCPFKTHAQCLILMIGSNTYPACNLANPKGVGRRPGLSSLSMMKRLAARLLTEHGNRNAGHVLQDISSRHTFARFDLLRASGSLLCKLKLSEPLGTSIEPFVLSLLRAAPMDIGYCLRFSL